MAEKKYDGMWCAMHVNIGGPGWHRFESRVGLACEGSEIEGLQPLYGLDALGKGTILVGELEATSEVATKRFKELGYRRLHLYDVISWDGTDMRDLAFRKRTKLLRSTIWHQIPREVQSTRMLLVEQSYENFVGFYDKVIAEDGEGIVVKMLDSAARPTRASGKVDEWMRCKPWRTNDYVIVGWERTEKEELTARLALYRNGKYHVVMRHPISGLELKPDGKELVQHGMVVEMYGREEFASGAIRHAQFLRYRKDKRPEDCTGNVRLVGEKPQ